jgi:uncharacterized protein
MQDERFEWHDRKARINIRDHGVTFEDATQAFDDVRALDNFDDSMDYDEERSVLIGMAGSRLLVVIYTMRGERIRIISAREPENHEQESYFDQGR